VNVFSKHQLSSFDSYTTVKLTIINGVVI